MQEHNYPIKDWAKDDRPREKLLMSGAENLSSSELLALLIQKGTRNRSAIDLARDVLRLGKDNLAELGKLSVHDFMRVKGIGEVKAITIAAALELGRRRQEGPLIAKTTIGSSNDIAGYLQGKFRDLRREVFAVLFLNMPNAL